MERTKSAWLYAYDGSGKIIMKFSGKVSQVLKNEVSGYPVTRALVLKGEETYDITFLGRDVNVKEGKAMTIYGLPLAYYTYKAVSGYNIWAIKIAGVYAK